MSDLKSWRTLRRDTVFSSGPVLDIAVEVVELPDHRTISDYHVIRLADYVLVFAETEDGSVAVLRQYKHGPRRVCVTFPGGAIGEEESPLDAARRELLEETGCTASDWRSLGTFVTNANQGCNTVHLFKATACHRVREPETDDLEEMSLQFVDPRALLNQAGLAEIGLASHVALLLLATHPSMAAPDKKTAP